MAELIDKHTIIRFHIDEKDYENLTDYGRGYTDAMKEVLEIIDSKPFITEAEIRANAISEVIEAVKKHHETFKCMPSMSMFYDMAEQLKGE